MLKLCRNSASSSCLLSALSSNTYRIFDEKLPERLNPDEVYKDHKYASRDPEVTEMLKTHNIPQPHNVRFIRTNVRFLNEPIVHMETENTKDEQVFFAFDIRNNIPSCLRIIIFAIKMLMVFCFFSFVNICASLNGGWIRRTGKGQEKQHTVRRALRDMTINWSQAFQWQGFERREISLQLQESVSSVCVGLWLWLWYVINNLANLWGCKNPKSFRQGWIYGQLKKYWHPPWKWKKHWWLVQRGTWGRTPP